MNNDAEKILIAAAAAESGYVIQAATLAGSTFNVSGGPVFAERVSGREEARWEAAIDELVSLGYLTLTRSDKLHRIGKVTLQGYQRADSLAEPESGN